MSLTQALDSALQQTGAKPAITWYDQFGRLELSGAVLRNWIIKSTNMATEELELESGHTALLDMPLHWRTLIWTAAIWHTGATVHFADSSDTSPVSTPAPNPAPGTAPNPEVILSSAPSTHTDLAATTVVVAQSLGALDRAFPGELPSGALDATAQVRGFSDQYGYLPSVPLSATALVSTGVTLSYQDLLNFPLPQLPSIPQRLAVDLSNPNNTTGATQRITLTLLRALAAGHSLVVFAEERSAEDLEHLRSTEVVTSTLAV